MHSVTSRLVATGALASLALLSSGAPGFAQTTGIGTPEALQPAVLEHLGSLDGLIAFAVASDGTRGALAFSTERDRVSELRIVSTTSPDPRRVEFKGVIRALLFAGEEETLYALVHHPKKKVAGDTYLGRVDLDSLKLRDQIRVPVSSRDLEYWYLQNSLLVAAANEIRSFVLPRLRSGPLFRLPGPNNSVESLGTSSLVLVGQNDSLLLVDLHDPPGPESMPVRKRIAVPGPVVELAASADGSHALAKLADGRMLDLDLDSWRLVDAGTALALTDPRPLPPPTEAAVVAMDPPAAAEQPAELPEEIDSAEAVVVTADPPAETVAPAEPRNEVDTAEVTVATTAPLPDAEAPAEPPDEVDFAEAPTVTTAPPAEAEEPVEQPDPMDLAQAAGAATVPPPAKPEAPGPTPGAEPPAATAEAAAQIGGRVLGEFDGPVWVVLLGPDNMLNEAGRVALRDDGSWQTSGLPPGGYRVQLDGGGNRVLITEPPFLLLDLAADQPLRAPEIRILGQR